MLVEEVGVKAIFKLFIYVYLKGNGYDLPGGDLYCYPDMYNFWSGNETEAEINSPSGCQKACLTNPECTHYTWFNREGEQTCCIKASGASYDDKEARPDLAPIFSEIIVSYNQKKLFIWKKINL